MISPDYIMGLKWTDENVTYLGDGVYAQFDGYHIVIRSDRPAVVPDPWVGHQSVIALEPEVLAALNRYAERIKQEHAQ